VQRPGRAAKGFSSIDFTTNKADVNGNAPAPVTVADLAAKCLPAEFLGGPLVGLTDFYRGIAVPYLDAQARLVACKWRFAVGAREGYSARSALRTSACARRRTGPQYVTLPSGRSRIWDLGRSRRSVGPSPVPNVARSLFRVSDLRSFLRMDRQ
jgi:hypothetical protein